MYVKRNIAARSRNHFALETTIIPCMLLLLLSYMLLFTI